MKSYTFRLNCQLYSTDEGSQFARQKFSYKITLDVSLEKAENAEFKELLELEPSSSVEA